MSVWGAVLVALGILIVVSAIFIPSLGLGEIFWWIVTVALGALGIRGMVRGGFPRGLVFLFLATMMAIELLGIKDFDFWQYFWGVVGIWLVQLGVHALKGERWSFKFELWR